MDRQRLDDILDNALDELDDESSTSSSTSFPSCSSKEGNTPKKSTPKTPAPTTTTIPKRVVFGPPRPPPLPPPPEDDSMDEMMRRMEELFDPTSRSNQNNSGGDPKPPPFVDPASSASQMEMDATVTKLLQELSRPPPPPPSSSTETNGCKGSQNPSTEPDLGSIGEEMMNEMASGFEDMLKGCSEGGLEGGKDPSLELAVDGILRQLLGRDLMYEPMRDICQKFPEWLAENKAGLSEDEYQRYGRQYQCFQRIVAVYEQDPNNFDRLSELMHDAQEYGIPPTDLIKELAPGLEFDEKGMPKMDPSMFDGTGIPGGGANSFPFGGKGGEDAQCCTM